MSLFGAYLIKFIAVLLKLSLVPPPPPRVEFIIRSIVEFCCMIFLILTIDLLSFLLIFVDLGGSQHSNFNGALFCLCRTICFWGVEAVEGLISFSLFLASVSKSSSSGFLRDGWAQFLSFLSLQRFETSLSFHLPEFCYTLFLCWWLISHSPCHCNFKVP